MPDGAATEVSESFKAYEDGKHRRYSLLFAVNGGAFAGREAVRGAQRSGFSHCASIIDRYGPFYGCDDC